MIMLSYELVGQRIKRIRIGKRMSQAMLAEKTELSPPYISNIETGTKKPSLNSLYRIAHVLGVTINHFLHDAQPYDITEHHSEISRFIADCTDFEKQIVCDLIFSLQRHRTLLCK